MPFTGQGTGRFASIPPMRRAKTTLFVWVALLVLALPAIAQATDNDGRGFWGATNDKVVTDAGFVLIAFFPLFVFFMSMLQKRLHKRKEARIAHKVDLSQRRQRGR